MYCTKCGKEIMVGEKFCTGCGTPAPEKTTFKEKLQRRVSGTSLVSENNQKHGEKPKGWLWRVLVVVYVTVLMIGFFSICGIVISDDYSFGQVSKKISAISGFSFVFIVFLEIIRRALVYIVLGVSFFKVKIPNTLMAFVGILGVLLLVAGLVFVGYEVPQANEKIKQQKALEKQQYDDAKAKLPSQEQLAKEADNLCSSVAGQGPIDDWKATCQPHYREVKLNYDACREYGSHTMCISNWDYISASCDKIPDYVKRQSSGQIFSCSLRAYTEVNRLKGIISSYETNNK